MKTTTTSNTANATFTKLRSGDWGIRLQGSLPGIGDAVVVTKKDGERKTVLVSEVVWSDGRVHLCAIKDDRQTSRPVARASRSGRCRECGGPLVSVAHHRAMGGLCGQCAFDEYDC